MKIHEKPVIKSLLVKKSKQLITKLSKNKSQYNLDRQTAQILTLLSGNNGKYEFLRFQDFLDNLSENGTVGKSCHNRKM